MKKYHQTAPLIRPLSRQELENAFQLNFQNYSNPKKGNVIYYCIDAIENECPKTKYDLESCLEKAVDIFCLLKSNSLNAQKLLKSKKLFISKVSSFLTNLSENPSQILFKDSNSLTLKDNKENKENKKKGRIEKEWKQEQDKQCNYNDDDEDEEIWIKIATQVNSNENQRNKPEIQSGGLELLLPPTPPSFSSSSSSSSSCSSSASASSSSSFSSLEGGHLPVPEVETEAEQPYSPPLPLSSPPSSPPSPPTPPTRKKKWYEDCPDAQPQNLSPPLTRPLFGRKGKNKSQKKETRKVINLCNSQPSQ